MPIKTLIERIEKAKRYKTSSFLNMLTASGPYPQPMLLSQISYLSSIVSRVDQKPGAEAYTRYEELKTWLERLEKAMADLII